MGQRRRIAVIGHAEHVTVGRVPALPGPGGIAHLEDVRYFPGGGGAIAYAQVAHSDAEAHFFTAAGDDEAAREVLASLAKLPGTVHAAQRAGHHTRDLVLLTPEGERTIIVAGEPLHPRRKDVLAWELLAGCDAVYFTAQDPALIQAARIARVLLVTARRREALAQSGVRPDVVLGSALDARELSTLRDYSPAPQALVMTEGARGGYIETAQGVTRFPAPQRVPTGGGAYGAGDSFAGALTCFLAAGVPLPEACRRAGVHGAAVLAGNNPLEHQLAVRTDADNSEPLPGTQ